MSSSIFSSMQGENRWVLQIKSTFPREHVVDIDFDSPPCVYRVPKSLRDTKPEAYEPQQIGLGSYHHLQPDLYKMQRHKFSSMKKFLTTKQLEKFQDVVEILTEDESFIRACYDQYLDLDILTLSSILAIDGIYLLYFLSTYQAHGQVDDSAHDLDVKEFSKDVIMLENQIPVDILVKINKILQLQPVDEDDDLGKALTVHADLAAFCQVESPLELCEQFEIVNNVNQNHVLHRLYHLIVNNRGVKMEIIPMSAYVEAPSFFGNLDQGVNIAVELGVPGADVVQKHLTFMQKVPWKKIIALFMKKDPDEENATVEEINIPSVSQLVELAGVEFVLTKGGIRDIKFDEEAKKFHLPVITMRPNSEVILRNLVAFEAVFFKPGSNLEFSEYVDLICGIVDTPKDVDILRKADILKGDMPDEEIAKLFNGIRKSTGKTEKPSNVEEAIEKAKKGYDDIFRVRMYRCIKRYVYNSWKFLTFLSSILVILLLTVQAFCSVYGCSNRWFRSSGLTQPFQIM